MQIIERGKDKYLVRIFLRRTPQGKRLYHNKLVHGGKKKAVAYGRDAETKRDLGTLEQTVIEDPTFNEYLDNWLIDFKKKSVRERTYKGYEYILDKYVRPRLGKYKLTELTTLVIQNTYNHLTDTGYSPRTINFAHTLIKEALDQAIDAKQINYNPAVKTRRPAKIKPEPKSFTTEQAERFIREAKTDSRGILFWFALAIGARPEEYLALQWPDLDLEKREVHIVRSIWWKKGEGWKIEEVKTQSSIRTISFNSTVANALKRHKTAQQKARMKMGKKYQNNNLVFATSLGTPLHFRNLTLRHLAPIMKRAEIPAPVNLYRLRHSFVTLSLLSGADLKSVSRAAGHSTVAFTMDVYQTVLPEMRKDAGEKIGALLFRKSSGQKAG
jgi:integrase